MAQPYSPEPQIYVPELGGYMPMSTYLQLVAKQNQAQPEQKNDMQSYLQDQAKKQLESAGKKAGNKAADYVGQKALGGTTLGGWLGYNSAPGATGAATTAAGSTPIALTPEGIPAIATEAGASGLFSASPGAIGTMADGSPILANAAGNVAPDAAGALGAYAPYLGIAGAGLGAYGLYNAIKSDDPKMGALSGAGLGAGMAAMAPIVGLHPVGWAGLGLAAALGAGGGAGLASLLGHKSTQQLQKERWQDLIKGGQVPEGFAAKMMDDPTSPNWKGAVSPSVAGDFVGYDPNGQWTNNAFAQSRDESQLKAEDVWGSHPMFEIFGGDWLGKYSENQRRAIANKMIGDGGFRESKGMMDYLGDQAAIKAFAENLFATKNPGLALTPGISGSPMGVPTTEAGMWAAADPGTRRRWRLRGETMA